MILFFSLQNLLQKILLLSSLFVMMKIAWLNLAALKLSCVTKHVRIKTVKRFSYGQTRNSGTRIVCVIVIDRTWTCKTADDCKHFVSPSAAALSGFFLQYSQDKYPVCLQAFNLGWELVPVVIIKFTHISCIDVKRLSQQMSVCTHLNTLHIRHLTSV